MLPLVCIYIGGVFDTLVFPAISLLSSPLSPSTGIYLFLLL
jgi:hypothetical protein